MEKVFNGFLLIISFLLAVALYSLADAETLTWDKNADATYYNVYVREKGQLEYKIIGTGITGNSFEVIPEIEDKTYEYSVKAFNQYGNSSDFSDPVAYNKHTASIVQKVGNLRITITINVVPGS